RAGRRLGQALACSGVGMRRTGRSDEAFPLGHAPRSIREPRDHVVLETITCGGLPRRTRRGRADRRASWTPPPEVGPDHRMIFCSAFQVTRMTPWSLSARLNSGLVTRS